MIYDTQITIVNSYWATGLYKPTNITGGLHIVVPGEYLELAMGISHESGYPAESFINHGIIAIKNPTENERCGEPMAKSL